MTVFVSHTSAFDFWRSTRARPRFSAIRMRSDMKYVRNDAVVNARSRCAVSSAPLHVNVSRSGVRNPHPNVRFHVDSKAPLYKKFYKIAKDVAVSSPETCLLELSHKLGRLELIHACYEICSGYRLINGEMEKHPPVTSKDEIYKFLETCKEIDRANRLRWALLFVADNSQSPMETFLSMSFSVPRFIGGYRLPLPTLNHMVIPNRRALTHRNFFLCDLYWPSAMLCLEYDSNQFHFNERKLVEDSARRAALAACDISTLSITSTQFYNIALFDEAARAVGGRLSVSMPLSSRKFIACRKIFLAFVRKKQGVT